MTREEFEQIDNISDLLEFCDEYDCYVYDEIYSQDSYDDCVDDRIRDMVRRDHWTEVRDYLDGLPCDFDYYRKEEYEDEWVGLYEDDDFDDLKDEVRNWAEEETIFDDDDDATDEEREECEPTEPEEEEEEVEPDEPFTLSELVSVCKSSVQKIEDSKSKSEPDKASEEEYVKTCDPIALFKEN